jgi:AraC-like DNA-binding protein
MLAFNLPLEHLPILEVAGQFSLHERNFSTKHLGQFHALHLHEYSGLLKVDDHVVEISVGDLTITPAGLTSSYHVDKQGKHWCLHFRYDQNSGAAVAISTHMKHGGHLSDRFAHISALYSAASDEISSASARLATHELLLSIARNAWPLPMDDAPARAANFIDQQFMRALTIGDIAQAVGYSPAYLARRFRARFGVTMQRRLIQRRVEHAKLLLQSTDLPITQIAEQCGVPDRQHFNKLIRASHGCSPSALRAITNGG